MGIAGPSEDLNAVRAVLCSRAVFCFKGLALAA